MTPGFRERSKKGGRRGGREEGAGKLLEEDESETA